MANGAPILLSLLLLLLSTAHRCLSLEVTEEDEGVAARDDQELVLTCTGDEQWDYCR